MTKKEAAELAPLVTDLKANLDKLTDVFPGQRKAVKRAQEIADQIGSLVPSHEPESEDEKSEEKSEDSGDGKEGEGQD